MRENIRAQRLSASDIATLMTGICGFLQYYECSTPLGIGYRYAKELNAGIAEFPSCSTPLGIGYRYAPPVLGLENIDVSKGLCKHLGIFFSGRFRSCLLFEYSMLKPLLFNIKLILKHLIYPKVPGKRRLTRLCRGVARFSRPTKRGA